MIYLVVAEMLPEAIEEGGKTWPHGASCWGYVYHAVDNQS